MERSGFTLIELLIVVAIIGILAAIAVPNFMTAQIRAKVSRVETELRGLGEAYLMYKMDRGAWPPHIDGDPAQHRFITSPIPYYSASLFDPFQIGCNPEERGVRASQYQYHMEPVGHLDSEYNAMIKWWVPKKDRYPEYFEQMKNSAYGGFSFGPDHEYSGTELYEPSNGVKSYGDIYRLVPGRYVYDF